MVENTTLFIASRRGAQNFNTHQTDSRTGKGSSEKVVAVAFIGSHLDSASRFGQVESVIGQSSHR